MSHIDVPLSRSGFGQTRRADHWWIQPLAVFLGLSAFIVYATWAAFQGQHFRFGPYLSPFYSPELFGAPNDRRHHHHRQRHHPAQGARRRSLLRSAVEVVSRFRCQENIGGPLCISS